MAIKLEAIEGSEENVGIKALGLAKLIKRAVPVPSGFVITTEAFERFLRVNKLDEKIARALSKSTGSNLYEIYREIEELIVNSSIPETISREIKEAYDELSVGRDMKNVSGVALDLIKAGRSNIAVAVRSSPTNEDLSQLNTFLNVYGRDELAKAIKKCWASLFSPRAVMNSRSRGHKEFPMVAVIVQRMVNAEKSGIFYTANPDDGNMNKVLIEAIWGIGSSMSTGMIIPDEYLVDKATGEVVNKRIRKKLWSLEIDIGIGTMLKRRVPDDRASAQVLSDVEIRRLYDMLARMDEGFNGAQEIEWCFEKNKIFLIQAKDELILQESEASGHPGRFLLDGMPVSGGVASGPAKIVLGSDDLGKINRGDIVVTGIVKPEMDEVFGVAAGVIADSGGRRCRASVIANEKAIPCIVGTEKATVSIRDGQRITMRNGKVYEAELAQPAPAVFASESASLVREDVVATSVKLSMPFPEIDEAVVSKCDGVGVLKSESILTDSGKHPIYLARESSEDVIGTIITKVSKIAKPFFPKMVWYKLFDAKTDELKNLEGGEDEPMEPNPLFGWHGIRRSLDQQDLLRCEIEAIERVNNQGIRNVGVLVPFITNVNELKMLKEVYPGVCGRIKTGIVVEVPSAGLEVESFCREGVKYVLIDMDTLTQLVLGVDRNNSRIARLYSELDPGVLDMVKQVVLTCKKYGVETSVTGDVCSDPQVVEKMIELGVDSISTDKDSVDRIKVAVAKTEKKILLDRMRR